MNDSTIATIAIAGAISISVGLPSILTFIYKLTTNRDCQCVKEEAINKMDTRISVLEKSDQFVQEAIRRFDEKLDRNFKRIYEKLDELTIAMPKRSND